MVEELLFLVTLTFNMFFKRFQYKNKIEKLTMKVIMYEAFTYFMIDFFFFFYKYSILFKAIELLEIKIDFIISIITG